MLILSYIIIAVLNNVHTLSLEDSADPAANIPPDGRLNFTELANKYGYACEEYSIITEDNYILKVFHIPGDSRRPVYLIHGFLDSADGFIIRGNRSLAITLARLGYDIWVGNFRGNKYCRTHLKLNPDKHGKFWDFSLHEIGYYDQPATIDFILAKTSATQVIIIGHSEGSTVIFVLGSTRPEYNDKVKLLICLAPIAFLQNVRQPLASVLAAGPAINTALKVLGREELFSNSSDVSSITRVICTASSIGEYMCAKEFQTLFGRDGDAFAGNFLPIAIGHFPCGTSRKSLNHFSQIANRRSFSQYDHGLAKNIIVYKSAAPPNYNLSRVSMRVALLVGRNDKLATVEDVEILRDQLPNMVEYRVLEYRLMSHIDFVYGAHMYQYLFPEIYEVLLKFP